MKLPFAFSSFAIAAALVLTTAGASAQSRLSRAADSLEDSLKEVNKQFERRGDRFRDDAGSLFRAIDKSRDDSDRLIKEANQGKPKWQLQPTYQNLRSHLYDLRKEVGRYSLNRDERRAVDAVWWNESLTVAAWERYGGVVVVVPKPPANEFDRFERARTYATRYLTSKYRVPARDLNIGRTSDVGRIVRVKVAVEGIGARAVDIDPRSGAIVADHRE